MSISLTTTEGRVSRDKLSYTGSRALGRIGEYLPPKDKPRFFLWTNSTLRNLGRNSQDEEGQLVPGFISTWIYNDMCLLGYKEDKIGFIKGLSEYPSRDTKEKIFEAVLTIFPTSSQVPQLCILDMFNSKKDPFYVKSLKRIVTRDGISRDSELKAFEGPHFPIGLSLMAARAVKDVRVKEEMHNCLAKRSDIPIDQAISLAQRLSKDEERNSCLIAIAKRPDISIDQRVEIESTIKIQSTPDSIESTVEKVSVDQALEIVKGFPNVAKRKGLLIKIAARPDISIDRALQLIDIISYMRESSYDSDWDRLQIAIAIRPDISVDQAVKIVKTISNMQEKGQLLKKIVKRSDISIDRALEIVKTISDIQEKNQVLAQIAERPDISIDRALEIVKTISNIQEKDQPRTVFGTISGIQEKNQVLAKIVERPDISLSQALEIVKTISGIWEKDQVLAKIVERPDISLDQALEIVKTISDIQQKDRVLKKIVERPGISIDRALEIVKTISDIRDKGQVVAKILEKSDISIDRALEIAKRILDVQNRFLALHSIASRPDTSIAQALRIVDIMNDILDLNDSYSPGDTEKTRAAIAMRSDISVAGALEIANGISNKDEKRRVFTAIIRRRDLPVDLALLLAKQIIQFWEESSKRKGY